MANMTRRDIFRGKFTAGQQKSAASKNETPIHEEGRTTSCPELEAIAGDFPPELLSMEAERLGLDPNSPDRDTLLAAVYEAMAGSGPGENGR